MPFGIDQNNKPTVENGLTPKQSMFVDYYLESLNGSQSYERAYTTDTSKPTKRTCEVNSSKLLKHPNIQAILKERMEALESERVASAQEVVEFLTATMRNDKEKTTERLRSAELLGKRHALFTDKLEQNQNVEVEIVLTGDDEADSTEE